MSANPFDMIGAQACGWQTDWLKCDATAEFDPWHVEANATIAELGDLINRIRGDRRSIWQAMPAANAVKYAKAAKQEAGGGAMNKKFLVSWIVIFVAWMAGSFVVHGVLLHDDYAQLPNLFRPEADAQAYFYLMIAAHIVMAGAFVWIYARGNEDKPWLQQGIRYGVAIALLAPVPMYIIYYVVQPMPGMHVVKQIMFDSALLVVLGIIVAFLNKPQTANA